MKEKLELFKNEDKEILIKGLSSESFIFRANGLDNMYINNTKIANVKKGLIDFLIGYTFDGYAYDKETLNSKIELEHIIDFIYKRNSLYQSKIVRERVWDEDLIDCLKYIFIEDELDTSSNTYSAIGIIAKRLLLTNIESFADKIEMKLCEDFKEDILGF